MLELLNGIASPLALLTSPQQWQAMKAWFNVDMVQISYLLILVYRFYFNHVINLLKAHILKETIRSMNYQIQ